jgi:hypothetical protein
MAYEVVNTTAALTKQGQVTAFRMPTLPTPTQFYAINIVGAGYVPYPYVQQRLPPGTIGDAQLLYGSRSWAAAEGSYTVCRQNSDENRLQMPDFIGNAFAQTDFTTSAGTAVYTLTAPGGIGTSARVVDIHAPFDLSGTHYTGLSSATTLTVNVRWLIERSPGPNEPDLVVLATPSSSYDPLALELYTHCIAKMPPGVMLSENPLGEWFRNALSTVSSWAPKIGDFIGNVVPGASAVGKAVGAGAGLAAGMIPQQKKKMNQQLQKQIQQGPRKVPLQGSASTTGAKPIPRQRYQKNRRNPPAKP